MKNIIEIKNLNGRDIAVGEKIRVNGEVYKCVEFEGCNKCVFYNKECVNLACEPSNRKDHKNVMFIKSKQIEANENKELNLAEILKYCEVGTKLYSPIFGEVILQNIDPDTGDIKVAVCSNTNHWHWFKSNGKVYANGEVMLSPSRNQRDWSKFKLPIEPPYKIEKMAEYYYIDDLGEIQETIEGCWSDHHYNIGNYFNIKEQAEYASEKVKELLLSLRKEDR